MQQVQGREDRGGVVSMSPPYMPLYVADYLSATEHLDAAHSGAYLHLIMHYWQKGKLPVEDKFLARIARMTDRQWISAKPTIKAFFRDDWTHERIENEIAHAEKKAEARAQSGSRGGISKALNYKKHDVAKANYWPKQTPSKTPSEPLPSSSGLELEEERKKESPSLRSGDIRASVKPKSELAKVVGDELAAEVIAHRKGLRKPLTPQAADRLAKQFFDTGSPQDAARMMIDKGWQGFNAAWFANAREPPTLFTSNGTSRTPQLSRREKFINDFINRGSQNDQDDSRGPPIIDGNVFVLSGGSR